VKYKVKIRRDLAKVKPEAELIDGQIYNFIEGWVMDECDTSLYIGEVAMLPRDVNHPRFAPVWVARGDLMGCK